MSYPNNHTSSVPGFLLFFIGIFGLAWSLIMVTYYFIKLIIYLILLVFNLCRLAAVALSPSPKPSPLP